MPVDVEAVRRTGVASETDGAQRRFTRRRSKDLLISIDGYIVYLLELVYSLFPGNQYDLNT